MTNTKIITPVVAKILHTMKENEKATAVISPDFVKLHDPEFMFKQTQENSAVFDPTQNLSIDLKILRMCKVEDLYKDQKVFYKTIRVGEGAG